MLHHQEAMLQVKREMPQTPKKKKAWRHASTSRNNVRLERRDRFSKYLRIFCGRRQRYFGEYTGVTMFYYYEGMFKRPRENWLLTC